MKVGHSHQLDELAQWLVDATQPARTVAENGAPELVQTWQSRTATLYRFAWVGTFTPDVVIKLHDNAAEAQAHFDSLLDVAQALERSSHPGVAIVRPLSVSQQMGAVLMPYVAGMSLSSHLTSADWSSKTARDEIHELVSRCGVLLAGYHSGQPQAGDDAKNKAEDRLRTRIERALGCHVDFSSIPITGPVVQSYEDFHPGHVLVTPERKLALIDPPIVTQHDYFYRDLALFSSNLYMSMIQPRGALRNPLRSRYWRSLGEAFLKGYTTAADRSLTDDDMFYIRGWQAYYLARVLRKARRRRSYLLMSYYYVPIWRQLNELRRAVSQQLKHVGRHGT